MIIRAPSRSYLGEGTDAEKTNRDNSRNNQLFHSKFLFRLESREASGQSKLHSVMSKDLKRYEFLEMARIQLRSTEPGKSRMPLRGSPSGARPCLNRTSLPVVRAAPLAEIIEANEF